MRLLKPFSRVALAVWLGAAGLAVQAQERPLEEVGVVRSVSPATSTIVVDDRKLRLTTATRVTADEKGLAYSPISSHWVGRPVGMETTTDEQGNPVITYLHFFATGAKQ